MNDNYPGLPDYTGPTEGYFTLLHHNGPHYEYSHNVMERVEYIKANKPKNEVATRLRHIVYVGPDVPPSVGARIKANIPVWWAHDGAITAALKAKAIAPPWKAFDEAIAATRAPLDAELAALIPDCRWNGEEIVFPVGTK